MASPEGSVREAAEALLRSSSSLQNVHLPSPDISHFSACYSVNTAPTEYVITDQEALQGRMSSVRRFFCLFVTFDLAFSGLMWLICIVINGQNIRTAIKNQIFHYNIHTSLFDVVLTAICRFVVLLLFYGFLSINHWCVIALSTTATCAFLIVKVFLYNWVESHQPVFEVLLILTSFVLSWGEAWFLDFKVLPQELHARRIIVNNPTENERAPLLRNYIQSLPSIHTESVANFYSPLGSPEGSIHGGDHVSRKSQYIRLTREQENDYKSKAATMLEESLRILNHSDWTLTKRSNKDEVYVLNLQNMGKIFKIIAMVNIPPRYLLDELFYKVEHIPEWNPSLLESHKIQSIDEYTDISYQISASVPGVTSRDFVNIRHWKKVDESYVIAYSAIEHQSVMRNDKYIRGENGVGCWAIKPIPCESETCQFEWVLNTNLKGWIPQYILDKVLVDMMFDYVKNLRKYIVRLKDSGRFSTIVQDNI